MNPLDRIRTLPAGGQIALAAAAAGVIVLVLCGAWLAMRPRYEVLFRDLRPADAATIVAELDREKVPYRLEDDGATILAPASRIDQTRLAILGGDLPLKGTVGFELFNKSDMGLTEFAQRINYQRALQGELARTIMTIESVEAARVHLTLPEPSIFRAERKPAEASVTLSARPGRALTAETVAGVQRLVAASVPDLDVSSVVVLDARGSLIAGAEPREADGPTVSAAVQQGRAVEQYYAAALRRVLEPLYPDVAVAVLVPADQWAGAGEALREDMLSSWGAGRRDFRIQVDISMPGGVDEAARGDIGRLVAEAIGWSPDRGDVLLFSDRAALPPPIEPAVVRAAPQPVLPAPPRPAPSTDPAVLAWLAAAVAGLGLLALAALRRRRGRLGPAEREAYVRRLRRVLAEDAGHVG
jgi:flagellar M-ring protein FliF